MPAVTLMIVSFHIAGCISLFMGMCLRTKGHAVLRVLMLPFLNTVLGVVTLVLHKLDIADDFVVNVLFSVLIVLLVSVHLKFFYEDGFIRGFFIYILMDLYVTVAVVLPIQVLFNGIFSTQFYIHSWRECFLFLVLASVMYVIVRRPVRIFGRKFREVDRLPAVVRYIITPLFVISKLYSNLTPYFTSDSNYRFLVICSLFVVIMIFAYMFYVDHSMALLEKEYAEKQLNCQQRYYNNLQLQFLKSQKLKEQIENQLSGLRRFAGIAEEPEVASYIESLEHLISVLDEEGR